MLLRLPQRLDTAVLLPTSKSLSARALLINALSTQPIEVQQRAHCDDTDALINALTHHPDTVDIGAAGTAMRFLTAFYAARPDGLHRLTGTGRMRQRPIRILVDALRNLGADITYEGTEGCPPLLIRGQRLRGGAITLRSDVSSQYLSALLMIAPTLDEGLRLTLEGTVASRPYLLMTLRLMAQFGVETHWEGRTITVPPGRYHRTGPYVIEPDWSAASYWFALTALSPDPEATVLLPRLSPESLQGDAAGAALFRHLGVATTQEDDGLRLRKCTVSEAEGQTALEADFTDIPDLAQTFVVVCAMLRRPFHFTGLESLKIKETDRVHALITECHRLGVLLTEPAGGELAFDPTHIRPLDPGTPIEIRTYDDHRMAMAFAPAAFRHPQLRIAHPEVVTKSYPRFWDDLRKAGAALTPTE